MVAIIPHLQAVTHQESRMAPMNPIDIARISFLPKKRITDKVISLYG
jgi:hypothetical protein